MVQFQPKMENAKISLKDLTSTLWIEYKLEYTFSEWKEYDE